MNQSYNSMQKLIFDYLNGREYRIGLDLGVGSIGIAVVALQEIEGKTIPTDLIFSGSRIFTASIGAAERRNFRGSRNTHRHNRNRLLTLWQLLASYKMMLPIIDHKERKLMKNTANCMFDKEVQKQSPYDLRFNALSQELSLSQLGYALYHLANHRGSSSVRINLESSDEDKQSQKSFAETKEFAKKYKVSTFIELLKLNDENNSSIYRNKDGRKHTLMPTRNLILNELNIICQTQKQFYPEIFTEEFISKITGIINYENIKIVPDAGTCPFFPEDTKLPKCHFLNEERRLWEALNNSRIEGESLSLENKRIFFNILREGKDLTESTVRSTLKLDKFTSITLQGRDKKNQKIEKFRFKMLENKEFWSKLDENKKDQFFTDWTNCADDEKLEQLLQTYYGLSIDETEDVFATISLIGDYAPVGKKAMQIIIDYIIKFSFSYQEAVKEAIKDGKLVLKQAEKIYNLLPYYGEILSESTQPLIGKAWHSSLKDKFEQFGYACPNTNIDEKRFGRIANPVVHQTLNELRKIINEIITILDKKPKEIGIELSRELKVGIEEREKISRMQNKNEAQNAHIMKEYCEPFKLDSSYILRFKLSEEQGFVCPYCLENFKANDIAQGSIDIDHIFPYSQSADNSQNNLVMVHNSCNQSLKGARTPYQAFNSSSKWAEIEHFVKEVIPKKAWRFTLNNDQYKEWLNQRGFLARFSTDTSYIAKAAAQYIKCLFNDESKNVVRTLKGGETSTLRKAWGLHGLTHELGSRFIESNDGIYFNSQKKMRLDHRHHALDAITIAYSTNSYTKLINNLHKKGIKLYGIQKLIPLPQIAKVYQEESVGEVALGDKETFSQYIKHNLEHNCFISLKYDHDKNGKLLKDTAYTILFEKENQLILVTKKKITSIQENIADIDKKLLPKIYTETKILQYSCSEQEKLKKLLNHNAHKRESILNTMEIAEQQLIQENEKLKKDGKREIVVNEQTIIKKSLDIVKGFYYYISNNDKDKKFVKIAPSETQVGVAYDTGENLCIDLYYDNTGKLYGEIIRKVNAMNKNFIPEYKKNGFTCVEQIFQGDTLEINLVNRNTLTNKSISLEHVASIKAPNAPENRTFVRIATFTESTSGIQIYVQNILKSQKSQDASFTINTMQKWDVRRVILSPLGLIKYRSQILKNK